MEEVTTNLPPTVSKVNTQARAWESPCFGQVSFHSNKLSVMSSFLCSNTASCCKAHALSGREQTLGAA